MAVKEKKAKKEKPVKEKPVKKQKKKEVPQQWVLSPINEPVLDYHVYEMSLGEKLLYGFLAFLVGGALGLLFYGGLFKRDGEATTATMISNVVVFVVAGLIAAKVFLPMRREQLLKKRQHDLRTQFRNMLESLTASLASGNTVLDAYISALEDMKNQYSESAYITVELDQIVAAARNNIDLETMVDDLAKRSGIEDIEDFSNVFRVARGPGGNIADVMRQTHDIIGDKMTIEDEITSKMSSNQLELNVIMVAPVMIVGMLRFSSGTFAENFSSPAGVVATTIGLIIFYFAYRLGQKIVNSVR